LNNTSTDNPRTEYNAYVRTEWDLFAGDPARARNSLAATKGIEIKRVLDVGCGAGQELSPFVVEKNALGVGIDLAPKAGQAGRSLFASQTLLGTVAFVRAAAEDLPFRNESFDVVICRNALPYTDNGRALDEIERVLRPAGVCLLKFHHANFYIQNIGRTLRSLDLPTVIHDLRVLLAGAIYHLAGKQPRNKLTGNESFQTGWLMNRELEKRGLTVVGEMPDSNPGTPSFIVTREKLPA